LLRGAQGTRLNDDVRGRFFPGSKSKMQTLIIGNMEATSIVA
jgi:hypothetical protein